MYGDINCGGGNHDSTGMKVEFFSLNVSERSGDFSLNVIYFSGENLDDEFVYFGIFNHLKIIIKEMLLGKMEIFIVLFITRWS